jgi:hypothetical protein
MPDPIPPDFQAKFIHLLSLLVSKKYDSLEQEGFTASNTAEGIREAIERYPAQLTMPPQDALSQARCFTEIENSEERKEWMLVYDLWFSDNPSDLVLEATCIRDSEGNAKIVIDGIY